MDASILQRSRAYSFQRQPGSPPARDELNKRESKPKMSIKSLVHWIEAWRRYRTAVSELSQLSERELAELGLSREEIRDVARRTAGL
jgi:uncharacterized protein YjiS (DUF1127 family)